MTNIFSCTLLLSRNKIERSIERSGYSPKSESSDEVGPETTEPVCSTRIANKQISKWSNSQPSERERGKEREKKREEEIITLLADRRRKRERWRRYRETQRPKKEEKKFRWEDFCIYWSTQQRKESKIISLDFRKLEADRNIVKDTIAPSEVL